MERGVNLDKPKVAMMQPTFLPWLGFFELMDVADIFVFLDNFQFSRQSWGHRNQLLLSPGRVGMVTLPIRHNKKLTSSFLEIQEADPTRWRRKFLTTIRQSYGKAPYARTIIPFLEEWLSTDYANIADLEIAFIKKVAAYIGITTDLRRSSEMDDTSDARRSHRVVRILKALNAGRYFSAAGSSEYMRGDGVFPLADLPVSFQDFHPKPYPQIGALEFVPRLSVLDALFNLDVAGVREMMHGTKHWKSWDEMMHSDGVQ